WVREASYTSFLDFSVAQDGYFAVSSMLKPPVRPQNDERYNAFGSIEEVPEDQKGKTYAIYHLSHKGERPDLHAFPGYYQHFRTAEEAAYDGDAVRMEFAFSLAVNHIYANDNFSYEDKIRYHRSEYAHLVDVLRKTDPEYKGGPLPPKPCR
ncbi:MAG: hypothetical protein AAF570_21300, partial [Bacteroidota bacterium]